MNESTTNEHERAPNHKPLTINHNNKNLLSTSVEVNEIFDYWVKVMGKNKSAKLTNDRKTKIKTRLKDGYTVDEIKEAIDGCASSAYHMGQNDDGKVYDDIALICRTGSKLEGFWQYLNPVKHKQGQSEANPHDLTQEWWK